MTLIGMVAAQVALLAVTAGTPAAGGWGGGTDESTPSSETGAPASSQFDGLGLLKAKLNGFEETPSIVTTGRGRFRARLAADGNSIDYELVYSDLEAQVTAAHIHVAQKGVAGGIAAFLCGGGGKPDCPPQGGTVTGTITPADVIGPADQGIQPGQFDRLLAAIRAHVTYANVHSTLHPAGEIRGQINVHPDREDDP